jgi:dihydroorotate dehydrogenase
MGLLYKAVRPLLFFQDPENVHDHVIKGLGHVGRSKRLCSMASSMMGSPPMPVSAFGLHFPNPVGLAAGMDKEAQAVPAWQALGLGFSELGGVTSQPQPGNDRPRIFRVPSAGAIINRMGFNNSGAEAMARRLAEWRRIGRWPSHPVGINIGKSKVTPLDRAAEDYATSMQFLWPWADFFVVNVSSPNTPGLRQLQDKAALAQILMAVQDVNNKMASTNYLQPRPILVKVSPDLSFEALDDILELVGWHRVSGIVATNTTTTRPAYGGHGIYAQAGGLSGRPLHARSTEVIRYLYRQSKGAIPIIGVGGIFNAADAWDKIVAGATLVQVYTGLVYEGPGLAKSIVQGLIRKLEQHSITFSDAIGLENKL